MDRWFRSANKGKSKVKATPELIKLWGSSSGRHLVAGQFVETYILSPDMSLKHTAGEKLRNMLYDNDMNMDMVALLVERETIQEPW